MLRCSAPASTASGCSHQHQHRLLAPARLARSANSSNRPRRRQHITTVAAVPTSSSSSPEFLPLGDGDAILLPRARPDMGPTYMLSKEEAVEVQMQALKNNDKPSFDHGIEVLYRFANFDPFQRSQYFGKSFDLGQFERFRRIMHIPAYKPLLNWQEYSCVSSLKLSESVWKTRLHVVGPYGKDEGHYTFTMVQRLGGRYDGWWFTQSLVADGNDWKTSIISF